MYLQSGFSWLGEGVKKTLRKRLKQTEEKKLKIKTMKNEEYKKIQITANSNNIFGFTFL